jgi:Raf kinase inhibitor-like YbhB/YbcL family protein
VVFNIHLTDVIEENTVPGTQGINDFRKLEYGGPCPPSGTHRYIFKLYALDEKLHLEEGCKKKELEEAMQDHILAEAELIGLYIRVKDKQ